MAEMQHAQMALRICQTHENEELDLYCRTCGKLLCADCVREGHFDHKWLVLKKYASELRALAHAKTRDLTSQIDSISGGHEAICQCFKAEFDHEYSQNRTELEAKRSSLHRIVDEIIDKREDDLQQHSDQRTRKLQSFSEDLKDALQRIEKLRDQLRDESVTLSNYDIVELYEEIDESLLKLRKSVNIPTDCLRKVAVSKKEIDKSAIESMVGSINKTQKTASPVPTLIKELELVKGMPLIFRPQYGGRVWFFTETGFRLIDFEGQQAAIDVPDASPGAFWNFDIAVSGDIYIPDKSGKSICSASRGGESKVLFSTTPLTPGFLTVTYSGDILVSLFDEESYSRKDTSRRLLRRMTMEGEVIKEYEYDNDGITPLFTHPGPSVEHYNGNICIVNGFTDKDDRRTGTVLGLDFEGNVRFRYSGIDGNMPFLPLYLSSDMMENTVVSDYNNRRIHLTDAQGSFVKFLLSEQPLDFVPSLVAVCEHYLYVNVFKSGTLKVYNYKC